MGVVGIETAFPVLYTHLVKKGIISLEKLVEVMSINPCRRFGIKQDNCWSVWNLEEEYTVDPESFLSMGRATPFKGDRVFGKCLLTVHNGKIVWSEN